MEVILSSLHHTHVNMKWADHERCDCACMSILVPLIYIFDFVVVVSIFFLYELGWTDKTQAFSRIAFFGSVDNSELSEGHSFTIFLIISHGLVVIYIVIIAFLLRKGWKNILGANV